MIAEDEQILFRNGDSNTAKEQALCIIADEEFHCPGSFGPMHKGRPNAGDIADVKEFAKQFCEK